MASEMEHGETEWLKIRCKIDLHVEADALFA